MQPRYQNARPSRSNTGAGNSQSMRDAVATPALLMRLLRKSRIADAVKPHLACGRFPRFRPRHVRWCFKLGFWPIIRTGYGVRRGLPELGVQSGVDHISSSEGIDCHMKSLEQMFRSQRPKRLILYVLVAIATWKQSLCCPGGLTF